jgi:hypothetical protein
MCMSVHVHARGKFYIQLPCFWAVLSTFVAPVFCQGCVEVACKHLFHFICSVVIAYHLYHFNQLSFLDLATLIMLHTCYHVTDSFCVIIVVINKITKDH